MEDDKRIRELVRRALDHYSSKGTNQAPSTMSVPVDTYLDPARFFTKRHRDRPPGEHFQTSPRR